MDYTFNVIVDDPSYVEDLADAMKSSMVQEIPINSEVTYEVKEPHPVPWSLSALDPGTVQIILGLIGGSSSLALALKGLFRILEKFIETRRVVVKVTYGRNALELSGRLSEQERSKFVEEFIQSCEGTNKK